MSTTRIVATDVTRSLPAPNSKTFPMTGAARSVARQRKVSAASRKKISIKATGRPSGRPFLLCAAGVRRYGMEDTRYSGVFYRGRQHACWGCVIKALSRVVLPLSSACCVPKIPGRRGQTVSRFMQGAGCTGSFLSLRALSRFVLHAPARTGPQRDACVA